LDDKFSPVFPDVSFMTPTQTTTRWMRMLLLILLLSGFVALAGWWFVPVSSGFTKVWLLSSVAALWVGLLGLCGKRKVVSWIGLALPVLGAGFFLLPGKEIDQGRLRDAYVKRMRSFEGTRYYWGGEGGRGIDCSGLPRRAFRDALLAEGLEHGNGSALRAAVEQWWFDASARAMMEGYREYVRPLGIAGTVRSIDVASLQPGDMAITTDGVHVVVYAGGGGWIQADPGAGKVVTLDPSVSDNGWFNKKVSMFRWSGFRR
jgi:hypothetical protein